MKKKSAELLGEISFPECFLQCFAGEYFGISECYSFCPWKFSKEAPNKQIQINTKSCPIKHEVYKNLSDIKKCPVCGKTLSERI